jgi:8-oxo-dGTP diphosphatase
MAGSFWAWISTLSRSLPELAHTEQAFSVCIFQKQQKMPCSQGSDLCSIHSVVTARAPNERPSVTVDAVVFSMRTEGLVVLLVERKFAPFKKVLALPGGFVNPNEKLRRACLRELEEETGVSGVHLQQLGAFGDPGRDPRGHTVSIVFFGFVLAEGMLVRAGDDAASAGWYPLEAIFPRKGSKKKPCVLAFDHREIISNAYQRLVEALRDPEKLAHFNLVPENFTLAQLFQVYEAILHRPINRRGFAKKLLDMNLVEKVGTRRESSRVQLYRWKHSAT